MKALTPREQQVFTLIVEEGLTNKEISEELGISERVVKFHATNVLHKFGMSRIKLIVHYWKVVRG